LRMCPRSECIVLMNIAIFVRRSCRPLARFVQQPIVRAVVAQHTYC
jgi:hypothetical protein